MHLPLLFALYLLSVVRGHDQGRHRRFHRRALNATSSDPTLAINAADSSCAAEIPQSQVTAWESWLQEGFDGCSKTAGPQVRASSDAQLVFCYRLGFVDKQDKRFGGELLVMQVGTPEKGRSVAVIPPPTILSNVVSTRTFPTPHSSAASATQRMTKRAKPQAKAVDKRMVVQLSFGAGSKALSAPIVLVDTLTDASSTNITSPAFSSTFGSQQGMLIGSFHFDWPFPLGLHANGSDTAIFKPKSVDVVGQAGQVLSIGTMLVNLAGVSAQEASFNSTGPWGLFSASTARSNRLTSDDRCTVRVVDAAEPAAAAPAPQTGTTPAAASTPTSAVSVAAPATTDPTTTMPTPEPSPPTVSAVSAAADSAAPSASNLPGTQLAVVPIGLGVFGGVAGLSVIIVGFVTWERRKHRKHFRSRKAGLGEEIVAAEKARQEDEDWRRGEFRGPLDPPMSHVGAPFRVVNT